jgi:polysaccharide export outer membrane protein
MWFPVVGQRISRNNLLWCIAALLFLAAISSPAFCQLNELGPEAGTQRSTRNTTTVRNNLADLVLGPGDLLTIAAPEIEELDRRELKVQADGTVSVPLVGPVKAAGLTPEQLATTLMKSLETQFKNPRLSFTQVEIHSKPVTVLGSVKTPGVIQADGRKRLLEIISLAGGLSDDAGPTLTLSRKSSEAAAFPSDLRTHVAGDMMSANIPISELLEGENPSANIVVLPGDIITVPRAHLVYVLGDVRRAGGFVLGESNDLTVLKALSLAQGLKETASPSHARILRADASGKRTEENIDLKKLLNGKAEDITLRANDILFVPSSLAKKVFARGAEAAVDTGTGIAIYRR